MDKEKIDTGVPIKEVEIGTGIRTTENEKKRVYLQLDRPAAIALITTLLITKDDCFLSDLCEDIQRKPAKTVGEGRDIVVTVRPGLEAYGIEMIQAIEKAIDSALIPLGFTRSKSAKWGHRIDFVYYQFAKVLDETETEKSITEKDS